MATSSFNIGDLNGDISSLNSKKQDKLNSIVKTIGDVTIGSYGYLDISSYRSDIQGLRFAFIETWTNSSPVAAFSITGNGSYLIGSANQQITGLKLRYFYQDNS